LQLFYATILQHNVKGLIRSARFFNRKSISRNTTHPQSYNVIQIEVLSEPSRLIHRRPAVNLDLLLYNFIYIVFYAYGALQFSVQIML